MGNNSAKSLNKTKKKKNLFGCLCTSSSCSIDEKCFPTFDRIYHYQSIDDLDHNEQLTRLLTLKSNREFLDLIKKFRVNFYLKDYRNRLKNSKIKQTFRNHFSSSTIIHPSNDINQYDFNLVFISPPESILPTLLSNTNCSYQIHEQLRSKCYFIPVGNCQIEPNDEEYKKKSVKMDRTHVGITLENDRKTKGNKIPIEFEPSCIFVSKNSFQTGFIRVDKDKIDKQFLPFIYSCSEENVSYLSSKLVQQWFNTLILLNQTCAIAKRFLLGDRSHMTCLLKEQTKNQSNKENSQSFDNNFIFAALRQPPCAHLTDLSFADCEEKNSEKFIDAFSPIFLSDNKRFSNNTIHIDYEQYSFAFILHRWPKTLIDNYYTHPNRYSKRRWPSKYHMNIIIKNSLLLIPNSNLHQWEINFDSIEEILFELMNESALYFYILCQQLFSQTYSTRILIKHCFLNYCEKYGLPFSNNQTSIWNSINHFLKDLAQQVNKKFIPNYFNHQINLLNPSENYNQWFDYIDKCLHDNSVYFSSSSLTSTANRLIVSEYLFYFIDQLYQTFITKQSEVHLNDQVLMNLHKEFCEKLSNTNQKKFISDLLNDKQILEHIQMNLTDHFETNAELVHVCLNQIRKAQTSLIFHYTWTIFIQYLHTYYNVLWNV